MVSTACAADIGMPGKDGYEVGREPRGQTQQAVLVALTGWGARDDRARTRSADFDHPPDPTRRNCRRRGTNQVLFGTSFGRSPIRYALTGADFFLFEGERMTRATLR